MTRLNQTFYSLSELCESPSFSVICLKLNNTFEVVNELWPQNRTNAYWNQCHKIVSTSQDPIFNLTWKIVTPAIIDCFPQTSEREYNTCNMETKHTGSQARLPEFAPASTACELHRLFNSLWLSFLLCKKRTITIPISSGYFVD